MVILDVKTQLDKLGKSRFWLSQQTGINANHISKIYNGDTGSINLNTIDKLCSALNCGVEDIIIYKSDVR